jgi:predicted Zn-dependent protease
VRNAIGPDRFDFIRIVGTVTMVGIAIAAVQLVNPARQAGASEPSALRPVSTAPPSAPPRTPTLKPGTGPTNPGEPTFRAVHVVPAPDKLRGRGIQRAPEPECPGTGQRVCIFALGQGRTVDVEELAAYFRATYGLSMTVLPAVGLEGLEEYEGRLVDQRRGQIRGTQMIEVLKTRFPTSANDGKVTLIAVTPHDLYREFSETPYQYAVRAGEPPTRLAIVSNARMDDRAWGEAPNADRLLARTRKLVAREVGLFHFGIPESPDPTSLTHNTFGSRKGVDEAAERLDLSQATLRPLPVPPPR